MSKNIKFPTQLPESLFTPEEFKSKTVNLFNLYYKSECACNAPAYAFWLSESKRTQCQQAKVEFATALLDLTMEIGEKL